MSEEHFLTVPSIPGEVEDDKHRDSIQVLSWSWGVSQTSPGGGGGGGGGGRAGKAQISDIVVALLFDSATPRLFEACARGRRFAEVVLSVRRRVENPADYLTLTMSDATVTSVSTAHSSGDPVVQLTLGFASVTMTHRTQRPDGQLGEPVSVKIGERV